MLEERIAKSRRQSISKADLIGWQLKSLEEAVDESSAPPRIVLELPDGQQEEA
jgi:hypothetical protein